jgi:hypothetical protein
VISVFRFIEASKDSGQIWIFRALFLVFLLYALFPAFVITPVENDDMRISLGALRHHAGFSHESSYRYDSQAGTYFSTELLSSILDVEQFKSFYFLNIVSTALFIILALIFLSKRTGADWGICGLTLLLFQDVYVSGYFANSNILAATPLYAGILLASRADRASAVLAGVFFALAIWFRFDAVLLALIFPVIAWNSRAERALVLFILGAIVAAVSLALLLFFSGANLLEILNQYSTHVSKAGGLKNTAKQLAPVFTGVVILLGLLGVRRLFIQKQFGTLALVSAGVAPTVFAYGATVTTPKYYLYIIPLFGILVVTGVRELVAVSSKATWQTSIVTWSVTLLFLGQYLFNPPDPPIASWRHQQWSADGPRWLTQIAVSPIHWFRYKRQLKDQFQEFDNVLFKHIDKYREPKILVRQWMKNQYISYKLLSSSFLLIREEQLADGILFQEYQGNGKRILLIRMHPRIEDEELVSFLNEGEWNLVVTRDWKVPATATVKDLITKGMGKSKVVWLAESDDDLN